MKSQLAAVEAAVRMQKFSKETENKEETIYMDKEQGAGGRYNESGGEFLESFKPLLASAVSELPAKKSISLNTQPYHEFTNPRDAINSVPARDNQVKSHELRGDSHLFSEYQTRSETRIIGIASGKGGVGKTTFAINLATTLATFKKNPKILLLDADWGMANTHIYLGEKPRYTIAEVLAGSRDLKTIIHPTRYGFDLIAGGNGVLELFTLDTNKQEFFQQELLRLEALVRYDFLIIDCGAGVLELTKRLLCASDEVIVVTAPEPAALTDAYSLIKVLLKTLPPNVSSMNSDPEPAKEVGDEAEAPSGPKLSLLVNQCESLEQGQRAGVKVVASVQKFLGGSLAVLGIVLYESAMRKKVLHNTLFILEEPHSPLAIVFRRLALGLFENVNAAQREDAAMRDKGYGSSRTHSVLSKKQSQQSPLESLAAYRVPTGQGLKQFFKKLFFQPKNTSPLSSISSGPRH